MACWGTEMPSFTPQDFTLPSGLGELEVGWENRTLEVVGTAQELQGRRSMNGNASGK